MNEQYKPSEEAITKAREIAKPTDATEKAAYEWQQEKDKQSEEVIETSLGEFTFNNRFFRDPNMKGSMQEPDSLIQERREKSKNLIEKLSENKEADYLNSDSGMGHYFDLIQVENNRIPVPIFLEIAGINTDHLDEYLDSDKQDILLEKLTLLIEEKLKIKLNQHLREIKK